MRKLVGNDSQVPAVLDGFLLPKGKFHINGLAENTITKILAVHAPQKWAVYNGVVAQALAKFGYLASRGASPSDKFIEFTRMMDKFKSETGLPDAYALDAFFRDVYQKLNAARSS